MKISRYLESQERRKALDRYALFTTPKQQDWSIRESKYDLYQVAKRAFCARADEQSRRQDFGTIYDNLRGWWRIGRNGSLLPSTEIFDLLLTDECGACSRSSGNSLITVRDHRSQAAVDAIIAPQV
jgi:hypothetical protein